MESKEALQEIKEYTLISYDENGEEDDCFRFGELEPNLIEAIEKDLDLLQILRKCKQSNPSIIAAAYNAWKKGLITEEEYNKVKEQI